MKTYKYKNYEEYKKCQISAYEKKINNCWAKEENIKEISDQLNKLYKPKMGICHGVRQGWEILWFEKYLKNCFMMGTDIGKPIHSFITQHDFNKQYLMWVNKFDFVYSNSFDHAYNPEKTFKIWVEQVKSGGVIILEYDRRQEHTGEISRGVNKTDPVSIRLEELPFLLEQWSPRVKKENIYAIDMPIITQQWRKAIFIEV